MSIQFKDNWTDFGKKWLKVQEEMAKKPYVKVGFPSPTFSKPHEDSTVSVGEVAVYNEFGTRSNVEDIMPSFVHTPERSFIRSTFDEKKMEIQDFIDKVYVEVCDGKYTTQEGLERIGQFAVKLIVRKINSGVEPPNAQSTIDRKGSSHTLIDSRQMVQTLMAQGFEVHLTAGSIINDIFRGA